MTDREKELEAQLERKEHFFWERFFKDLDEYKSNLNNRVVKLEEGLSGVKGEITKLAMKISMGIGLVIFALEHFLKFALEHYGKK